MKAKLIATAMIGLTVTTIALYPTLQSSATSVVQQSGTMHQSPRSIEVVFVLDTTSSMSGLIETAKEKIWSIATTMAQAEQAPEIRMGLVAFRDRGDDYITRVVDLSSDLDSMYATLMQFTAVGGGDGPESVNQALADAVNRISWSQDSGSYQVIFLVGDAPPHMDYRDEAQYPEIVAAARKKGIVINTIQCGDIPTTAGPWTQIASLGSGKYFQVEQAGSAVALATPYDTDLAELSARLDDTRLYFGSAEVKERMAAKVAATHKLHASSTEASRARRAAFNAAAGGKVNMLGENELVDGVMSGAIKLDELDEAELPEALQPMAPAEQEAYIAGLAGERADLQRQIRELAEDREEYLRKKVEEAGGYKDSLDQKIYEAVSEQASEAGLQYADGPEY